MIPEFDRARDHLERTPRILNALLDGLEEAALQANEGPGTWNAREVLAHLVLCERINFWPRMAQILAADAPVLKTMDMDGHRAIGEGKPIDGLLELFESERKANLQQLDAARLSAADLERTGIHPALGTVSLGHILHTWAAHDLTHLGQITRVLAKSLKAGVGPFVFFLQRIQ